MNEDKKIICLSWEEFEKAVHDIVNQIKQSGTKISSIYGKPRGGLILAVRLSHLLGKPMISKPYFADDDTLFVDDVVDTGGTFHMVQNNIASLYYNPHASFSPHFFSHIKPKDSWVVFPWETD